MKKTGFWLLALLMLTSSRVDAKAPYQHKHRHSRDLGIKAGGNFDKMLGSSWENSYQTGYHGGLFTGMREYYFGLQGELLLSSASYTMKDNYNLYPAATIKNLYLEIPVLFEIKITHSLWLQAGPQYNFVLNSRFSPEGGSANYFKSGDFSGVIGLQVFLPYHLAIGGRYVFGLSNLGNFDASSGDSWLPQSLQLFIAFRMRG